MHRHHRGHALLLDRAKDRRSEVVVDVVCVNDVGLHVVDQAADLSSCLEGVHRLHDLAHLLRWGVLAGEVDLLDEVVVVLGLEVLLVLHGERDDVPSSLRQLLVLVEHDGLGSAASVVVAGDRDLSWHVGPIGL